MKMTKDQALSNLMSTFKKNKGGTEVDPEYTTKDPKGLEKELQASFDKIFPELMKPSKHRKHVVFDQDVFDFFEQLSGDNGSKFSSMINAALRSFVRQRLLISTKNQDPVSQLFSLLER